MQQHIMMNSQASSVSTELITGTTTLMTNQAILAQQQQQQHHHHRFTPGQVNIPYIYRFYLCFCFKYMTP